MSLRDAIAATVDDLKALLALRLMSWAIRIHAGVVREALNEAVDLLVLTKGENP